MLLVVTILAGLTDGHPAKAQQLPFRLYGADSGLANTVILALTQDRAGFLYAATENGIYRYDGLRFRQMDRRDGLPETGLVEAVRAAPDGGIWIVAPDRTYLQQSGTSISVALEPPVTDEHAHRAAVLGPDLLLVRNHRLLRVHSAPGQSLSVQPVITDAVLARDPNRAALVAGFDSVFVTPGTGGARAGSVPVGSTQVGQGAVWLGCGLAICRLEQSGVVVLGVADGLPTDHWTALLRDRAGTLWLRSTRRIASLPRGAIRFDVVDVPGGPGRLANDAGRLDLVEDAAGRVVTQGARGLLVHDHGRWIDLAFGENLSHAAVTTMLIDREGSLWTGSTGQGVARLVGFGSFENWTLGQGLSDDVVWNASRDGAGTLWVATELAVDALIEPARQPGIATPAEREPTRPMSVASRPGRAFALCRSAGGWLWIGRQDGGLVRQDPRTGQRQAIAQLDEIRVMASDPQGPLWIGTQGGLVRIDHPDDAAIPTVSSIIPTMGRVFALTFDGAGEIWVLTQKTLFHRDGRQQWQAILQTDPEGGYQTRVMTFAPDGTLWLGSFTTGITRLHLDHGQVVGRDRLPSAHLVVQDVDMLRRDRVGRVWIGGDHGLDVTDGVRWRHLDDQDGLISNDISENAMFPDEDGTLWFGTSGGLSHLIDTRELLEANRPFGITSLHPVITQVSMGDGASSPAQEWHGQIHLQWSARPLVIRFAALDFKFRRSIRFRYRLHGVDLNWVDTTVDEARYPAPPSGKLVFEVMAVDPSHGLSSTPVRFTIKMRPPWWRMWPVSVGAAFLALGGLVLLWRLRIGYLLVRQRQLEALVVVRTHEIEQARLVLFRQANFDVLTGLLNRPAILERLRLTMHEAAALGRPLAVALLDLDNFKRVNDGFGHLGGDAVLAEIGRRLSSSTREGDQAGRYGGEELLLVLPGLKPGTSERIETLRAAVFTRPVFFEDNAIPITCSMGVTWMRAGDDITSMIRRADAALYEAKANGRDQIVFHRLD